FEYYTGTASVTNLGTLTLSAAGSHTISLTFNNGGTVNVNAGTLVLSGNGTDTGVYGLASGTGLSLSGGTRTFATGSDVSGPGTLTASGATVNVNVPLSLAAASTALVISSGVMSFNATTQTLPNLVMAGGTLAGSAAVTVTGTFDVTVSGSVLTGPGL